MRDIKQFNPICHPICFTRPLRTAASAWTEHTPFSMYLIDLLRPKTFVELGTYLGTSYCAFCQAIKELGLATRCYGIDTWQGDEHGGYYGPEILPDFRLYHDPLYGAFSQLIQSTFDEALNHFADGSIDLLHIDGYHTYEVVSHDFESWLPKMSERGVILLHDTNERTKTFGGWKLFEEKKQHYPHFEFLHGHGLGLLAIGQCYPEPLRELLEAPQETWSAIRDFFFQLGLRIEAEQRAQSDLAQAHYEVAQYQTELENIRAHAYDLAEQLETARHIQTQLVQTQSELAQAQNDVAQTRTELENARAYTKELSLQLEAEQEAKTDLENRHAYAKSLHIENESLHKELEAASAEVSFLQHSRGVRLIKRARVARRLLVTQGLMAATKQTLLWLGGKRSSHQKNPG